MAVTAAVSQPPQSVDPDPVQMAQTGRLVFRSALRLTPDEWMIPLFGQEQPEGKRNVLEGRLIWLALSALRLGVNVVLDFGVWGNDERSALRALAASVGATSELVYLPVDEEEQWRRVRARSLTDAATTFEMTEADLERWQHIF
jgi:predicted kinase